MAKIVRFIYNSIIFYGVIDGESVWRLSSDHFEFNKKEGAAIPLAEVNLLAPCQPTKVVAVGLNYRDHAAELGMKIPDEPILFLKPSTSVCGPNAPVLYPHVSSQVDYEAELGIVIKRVAKGIDALESPDYILGYTCVNDITARDLQKRDGQWTRAKSFDTFCPIGPHIETELDPTRLTIRSYVNGELKQDSSTANQIISPYKLVSFISKMMTLLPGDIVATGTPPGVGPVKIGDEVDVCIEGIGRLRNYIVEDKYNME